MARTRDDRGTRYYDDEPQLAADRERRHRRRRARDIEEDEAAAKRERRERRRADDARRQAEMDIEELRQRRESYYNRPESERRRTQDRMAQEVRLEKAKAAPRVVHREVRRDGTRRTKKRDVVPDDRSDEYVYGRPASRGVVEEVRRSSARKRSDEGGSSSRTAYTPHSGSGSASVRRGEASKLGRSMSAREPSKSHMATRPTLRRTSTIKTPLSPPPVSRSQSTKEVSRRSTGGIFANLFTRPSPRTPTGVVHKEVHLVDCLVCMNDELPVHKTVKLSCGHRMCHSCLKRQFTLSVQDPAHMPPRCCTSEHIPLKYAERLFDDKFKILWNKKYQEYTTSNRLYCPNKGCGRWIKPSKIRNDLTYGRKYARCGTCSTKVCVLCNQRFHTKRDCPMDEETNRLVQMAKEQGWQRCYNCKAVVELKEGCNHMTCRCTAQFCMVCAAPWKTCNCPWFNYQDIEDNDRLNDMRVPYTTRRQDDDVVEVIELPDEPSPPLARRSSTRARRSGRDRDREHEDLMLARQIQAELNLSPTPRASESRRANPPVEIYGVGNTMGHHMNDSYTMRPVANTSTRAAPRAPPPAPRGSFFSRRISREAPPPARPSTAAASAMAGLSRDGTRRGQNRVGTWLSHVSVDEDAVNTAPRGVEVDEWRCDGTMVGID